MIEKSDQFFNLPRPKDRKEDNSDKNIALLYIERLRSAQSLKTDLEDAKRSVELWHQQWLKRAESERKFEADSEESFLASCLLKNAIMAYGRLVDGGSLGRVQFPLDNLLTTIALKQAHERIVELRNQSIAHHGEHTVKTEKWSIQHVILSVNSANNDAKFMFPWKEIRSRQEAGADLAILLDAVGPTLTDWYEKTRKKAIIKLQRLNENNLLHEILTSKFDPSDFYTNKEIAENWIFTAGNSNNRFSLKRLSQNTKKAL